MVIHDVLLKGKKLNTIMFCRRIKSYRLYEFVCISAMAWRIDFCLFYASSLTFNASSSSAAAAIWMDVNIDRIRSDSRLDRSIKGKCSINTKSPMNSHRLIQMRPHFRKKERKKSITRSKITVYNKNAHIIGIIIPSFVLCRRWMQRERQTQSISLY